MSKLRSLYSWMKDCKSIIVNSLRELKISRLWFPWMRDWKNLTIALLAFLLLVLSGAWIAEHAPRWIPWVTDRPAGEPVSVLDVVLDRQQLRTLDIIFDRSLGTGRVGEILTRRPALIDPEIGGV